MAKAVTVPENEILKYYRMKNLTTPPEVFELSELDKDMSEILSRTDLDSETKGNLYYRTLVKFRNLFKSSPFFESLSKTDDFKDVDKKQQEIEQHRQQQLEKQIAFVRVQT